MRSILRATKNVVEQNTTKALAPTGVLWNPEAALVAAGAVTGCYAMLGLFTVNILCHSHNIPNSLLDQYLYF
jgi:hypothetical protein